MSNVDQFRDYKQNIEQLTKAVQLADQRLAYKTSNTYNENLRIFLDWENILSNSLLPNIEAELNASSLIEDEESTTELVRLRGALIAGMFGLARTVHVATNNLLHSEHDTESKNRLTDFIEHLDQKIFARYILLAPMRTIDNNPIDWSAEHVQDMVNTLLLVGEIGEARALLIPYIDSLETTLDLALSTNEYKKDRETKLNIFAQYQSLAVLYRRRGELYQSQRDQFFAMKAIYEADKIIPVTARRKALAQYAVKASVSQWRTLELGERALNFIRGTTTAIRMEIRGRTEKYKPTRSRD